MRSLHWLADLNVDSIKAMASVFLEALRKVRGDGPWDSNDQIGNLASCHLGHGYYGLWVPDTKV